MYVNMILCKTNYASRAPSARKSAALAAAASGPAAMALAA